MAKRATNGLLPGATQDRQSVTADWSFCRQTLIAGIVVKEVRHVPKGNGYLTEIYRRDWQLDDQPVDQVFQVQLQPGAVSAWHAHLLTTDRLFANHGLIRIMLYDARQNSATHGTLNEFRVGTVRPTLICVPPGVWHGVQNLGHEAALLLNLVNRAYEYQGPDHWRLPPDTDQIPYRFTPGTTG
jgi:dTDP-4-dehydrorhamnose 3,5-epimerase